MLRAHAGTMRWAGRTGVQVTFCVKIFLVIAKKYVCGTPYVALAAVHGQLTCQKNSSTDTSPLATKCVVQKQLFLPNVSVMDL